MLWLGCPALHSPKKENFMFRKTQWIVVAAAVSTALVAGCASKGTTESTGPVESTAPTGGISTQPTTTTGVGGTEISQQELAAKHSVYFDFDKSDIKPEGEPVVALWATYLSSHASVKVRLEGNADERGTREYNVGLGERRGNSVAQALEAKGVSPSQVSIVSYGKERPVCTEHKESCWSQNRRVDIVLQ
jgi:peptidoglycan-associated lipoprotein